MKVLVTGSRTFPETGPASEVVKRILDGLLVNMSKADSILVGDCPTGVDAIVRTYVPSTPRRLKVFHARWDKFGKAAGHIRNGDMVSEQPTFALGFVDRPLATSDGTNNCITQARKKGIPTMVCEYTPGWTKMELPL